MTVFSVAGCVKGATVCGSFVQIEAYYNYDCVSHCKRDPGPDIVF